MYLISKSCNAYFNCFGSVIVLFNSSFNTFNGRKLGSFGLISNFSFYYAHHLSTIEGGMICTNDENSYEALRMFRSHGMVREMLNNKKKNIWIEKYKDLNEKFIFTRPAFNVRNNEIGAIIGLEQLKRIDYMVKKRADNFQLFLEIVILRN